MKIAVIGTGYVDLVTGTCLAESGNDVAGTYCGAGFEADAQQASADRCGDDVLVAHPGAALVADAHLHRASRYAGRVDRNRPRPECQYE